MTKEQIFDQVTIEGNVVKLPDVQLDRKLYVDVNKTITMLGGKWNRKEAGFLFSDDPTPLIRKVQSGEKIVDTKKELQQFFTPDELALQLIELAEITTKHKCLEPSCGDGAILKHFPINYNGEKNAWGVELDQKLAEKTYADLPYPIVLAGDFLTLKLTQEYDRIVANPPFTKNQDIKHVNRMYELLKPGGRIVSIMSPHWTFAEDKLSVAFREFMEDHTKIDLPDGAFKVSGTNVRTVIVVINKPQ